MTKQQVDGQVSWFDADTASGKMSQVPSPATTEKTFKPSSRSSSGSQSRTLPMCLCLTTEDGPTPGSFTKKWGGWSVAWRTHDAQYWGVPQRRKRICVLADFNGLTADEILFDPQLWGTAEDGEPLPFDRYSGTDRRPEVQTQPESLSGDSAESGTPREGAATAIESGADPASAGRTVCYGISAFDSNAMKSPNPHSGIYEAETARTLDLNGGSPACNQGGMAVVSWPDMVAVYDARGNGDGAICPTITGDHNGHISDYTALAIPISTMDAIGRSNPNHTLGIGKDGDPKFTLSAAHSHAVCVGNGQLHNMTMAPIANTLDTMHDQQAVFSMQAFGAYKESDAASAVKMRDYKDATDLIVAAVDCRNGVINSDVNGTLQAKEQGFNINSNNVVLIYPEVRRLTPLECTRLQGFPDGWLDIGDWTDESGKLHREADAPKYKAAGNSIALPFWSWLARRICAQYERPITMASLFDGIGGFPLAFERCGAKAVWASEIEPYPIAVTKKHFPEEQK